MATLKGLEPSTSAVTGRRSNQLSYNAIAAFQGRRALLALPGILTFPAKMVGTVGIEPTTFRV